MNNKDTKRPNVALEHADLTAGATGALYAAYDALEGIQARGGRCRVEGLDHVARAIERALVVHEVGFTKAPDMELLALATIYRAIDAAGTGPYAELGGTGTAVVVNAVEDALAFSMSN